MKKIKKKLSGNLIKKGKPGRSSSDLKETKSLDFGKSCSQHFFNLEKKSLEEEAISTLKKLSENYPKHDTLETSHVKGLGDFSAWIKSSDNLSCFENDASKFPFFCPNILSKELTNPQIPKESSNLLNSSVRQEKGLIIKKKSNNLTKLTRDFGLQNNSKRESRNERKGSVRRRPISATLPSEKRVQLSLNNLKNNHNTNFIEGNINELKNYRVAHSRRESCDVHVKKMNEEKQDTVNTNAEKNKEKEKGEEEDGVVNGEEMHNFIRSRQNTSHRERRKQSRQIETQTDSTNIKQAQDLLINQINQLNQVDQNLPSSNPLNENELASQLLTVSLSSKIFKDLPNTNYISARKKRKSSNNVPLPFISKSTDASFKPIHVKQNTKNEMSQAIHAEISKLKTNKTSKQATLLSIIESGLTFDFQNKENFPSAILGLTHKENRIKLKRIRNPSSVVSPSFSLNDVDLKLNLIHLHKANMAQDPQTPKVSELGTLPAFVNRKHLIRQSKDDKENKSFLAQKSNKNSERKEERFGKLLRVNVNIKKKNIERNQEPLKASKQINPKFLILNSNYTFTKGYY